MREMWTDKTGTQRPVPSPRRLKFKYPAHAALRVFCYARDGYRCVGCGAKARSIPPSYDGHEALQSDRLSTSKAARKYGWRAYETLVLDHIVSLRNGGTNHPNNLQTLCDFCNASKSVLVDAKHGKAW